MEVNSLQHFWYWGHEPGAPGDQGRGDQGAPETEVLGVPQEPGDCQHQGPGDRADTGTPGDDAGRHGHGEDAGEQGGEAGHGGQ